MPLVTKQQQTPTVFLAFKPRLGAIFDQNHDEAIRKVCKDIEMPQTYTFAADRGVKAQEALKLLAEQGVVPVEIVKDTFQGARYQHREVAGSNGPIIHEDFKLTFASADENGKPLRLIMNFDLRDRTGQIATMKFQQVSPGEVVSLGASIFTNEGKNKDDTPNGKLYANKAVHVRIEGREDWTSSKGEKTNYVMIPKPDLEGLEVKLEAARARARTRAEEDALSPDDTNKQVAAACARVELANAIELAKVVEGKGFHKLNGQKQEAAAPTPAPSVGDGAPDEDLPIPEGDELPPGLLDEIAAASAMRDRQGMRG